MQSVDASLAAGAAELPGHDKHDETDVAATVVEYVLVAQSVHGFDPATVLYFPGTQLVHAPVGPVVPAAHSLALHAPFPQMVLTGHTQLPEPADEVLPDGQALHCAAVPNEPNPVLKVFAAQILHATAVAVHPGHSYPSLQ
jgi:hypothetical protein